MTMVRVRWRIAAGLLSCTLLLSVGSVARGEYKPLTKEEQAKVDKTIERGVAFLKGAQTDQGDWLWKMYKDTYPVGQCALPAYALLEAGVPVTDPVIKKAAEYLRPRSLRTDWTYEISLAILFFDRLGDPKDKSLIQTLALRLIAGQHRTGGWSYRCLMLRETNEQDLLKWLEELSQRMQGQRKGRDNALAGMDIPLALQSLTVFQRSSALSWQEPPDTPKAVADTYKSVFLDGRTDNSNTQFAMLALWTGQRHGISVQGPFEIMVERFERTQGFPSGLWPYGMDWELGPASRCSMICVGLLGLAVGRGLKLSTSGSDARVKKDVHVLRGLAALHQYIGKPMGHMNKRVPLHDLYYLWSLERVGVLFNLPSIGDKDWYRWGVESLVTNQEKNGSWPAPNPPAKVRGMDFKASMNTAFALLFLKRSHPMRDLTPKLPFTAKELNEGIARLKPDDKFPIHSVKVPNQSRSLEGTVTPPSQSKNP